MTRPISRLVLVVTFSAALPAAFGTGCAAQRPNTLPNLSAEAPEALTEPHQAANQAYKSCAESYNSNRIPWQAPVAVATGGLAALSFVGATATPLITASVLPAQYQLYVAAGVVGGLSLVTLGATGATVYLAAQVPPALERTRVQGRLLQFVEGRALEAVAAEDGEGLTELSREIYEDCRVVQASSDAKSAEVVIRDLQRYRREAQEAGAKAKELEATREELVSLNTALEAKVEEKNAAIKQAEMRSAAVEERIANLEEAVSQKQAENASLKSTVDRLEGEQAMLSEEKKKLLDEKKKLEEKTSQYEQVAAKLQAQIKEGKVALRRLRNGIVVEMQNKVLFPSGKAELNEQGLETLAQVAEAIKELQDKRIRVEGHTDNVPVGKNSEYASNWELSSARAIAVAKYLQDLGVNPANMSAEARSQYAPVATNKSPQGRARNRRIEIYLVPQPVGEASTFTPE